MSMILLNRTFFRQRHLLGLTSGKKMTNERPISHYHHSIYSKNVGASSIQEPLPLPPIEGLPFKINTYQDVDEPRFDPDVHLNLGMPEYVRVFPDFQKVAKTPPFKDNNEGSLFAYTSPFQVFSQDGIDVLNKIIAREEKRATPPKNSRGCKLSLRGLYYFSPFVRDLQNCRQLRHHFCEIAGEELIPHPSLFNSPQVNLSVDGASGPVDVWHYDSIAYTGVVLLNDVKSMDGGKLEIMRMNKHDALDKLANGEEYDSEVIGYEMPGKMILAQGSELLHHVTPVNSSSRRISLIFGFGPANSFQPPKTILSTMTRVDTIFKMARYEYFREKAWQGMHCLKHFAEKSKYSNDGKMLGEKLKSIAEELQRAGEILCGGMDDSINIFNELNGKLIQDYSNMEGISAALRR